MKNPLPKNVKVEIDIDRHAVFVAGVEYVIKDVPDLANYKVLAMDSKRLKKAIADGCD